MSLQLFALRPSPFPNTTNSISKTAPTTTTGHHLYERNFVSTHIYTHPSAILLELCTSTKELHQILPHIIKNGVYNEHLIQTKLVNLFCEYGSISEAVRVFEPVEQKLDGLYHTMLKGYAKYSTLCDALSFYNRMQCDEVRPVVYYFIYLLQLCGKNLDIKRGREIHGRIITNGFEANLFAMNAVVHFYVKCGQMNDAYKMFERMPQKDLISWTSLVKGFAQNGSPKKAVHLVLEMQEAGQKPDSVTLVSVLPAVADIRDLRIGRSIHGWIITNGFESDLFAMNAVVHFYVKCGQINDAYKMFERMPQKDLISWNSLVKGFAQNGSPKKAVHLVLEMQEAGQKPNSVTLVSVLPAVADIRDLRIGRSIHGRIITNEFESDLIAMNAVVDFYVKCGQINDAYKMFERMPQKDLISWNSLVKGFAQNGSPKKAVHLVLEMQEAGQKPNSVTLVSVLPAVADIRDLRIGRSIHGRIITNGFESDLIAMNAVVDFYVKCGQINDAYKMFERMPQKDLISWNSLVKGFAQNGSPKKAVHLVLEMQEAGQKPNSVTLVSVLPAVADIRDLRIGRSIHGRIITNGFESDLIAMNAVVDFYVKCGQINDAYKMFERMPQKNLISWTSLVKGFAQNGSPKKAVRLVLEMQEAGQKPNSVTLVSVLPAVADIRHLRIGRSIHGYVIRSGFESKVNVTNALLYMYLKCGSTRTARLVFEGMSSKCVVSWNTMIDGLAQNGKSEEAYATFLKMLDEGVKPTNVSMMGALHACSNLGDLECGRFVHRLLDQFKLGSNVSVMNSLISMYSKCKRVDIAASIFDNLKGKTNVTWNAMILGYAQNGCANEALNLFCTMQSRDIKPNSFTFVIVITALADLSVTRQAKWIHGLAIRTLMDNNFFVATALVEMYAKCGAIETASKLFGIMQERHVITWNAVMLQSSSNSV